jgi:hypothetical protein
VRTFGTGDESLVLREHEGGVVELLSGKVVLLSNASLGTEREFGSLARRVLGRPARRVLVGGLGFGATVAGVLESLDASGEILVIEKVPAVERLVRGELASVAGEPLKDARVTVRVADVVDVLAEAHEEFDAVLLGEFSHERAPVYAGRPREHRSCSDAWWCARCVERISSRCVSGAFAKGGAGAVDRASARARGRSGARLCGCEAR